MGALLELNKHHALKRCIRSLLDHLPFPTGERITTVRFGPLKGLRLPLDLGTSDRNLVFNWYEPWVQRTLRAQLRPGMVVWDVGAYIGYYVALACTVTGGTVLAIEPDADNVRRLHMTIAENDLHRVTVVGAAVGETEGEACFAADGMIGSLVSHGTVKVPVTTLDRLAEQFGLPDFVLMDIEGGEVGALLGGAILLNKPRPQLLLELHGDAGVAAAHYLETLGYGLTTQAGTPIDVQMRSTHRVHALASATPGSGL